MKTTPAEYPTEIPMPDGSGPESIVIGDGPFAYVSSLQTGAVYRVDLATGTYEVFAPPVGPTAVGMALDWHGRLFVCGGIDGSLSVIDTSSKTVVARYQLGSDRSFINEIVLTPHEAWVTDSFAPVLYRLPFDERGELPAEQQVLRLPITGVLVYQEGPTFAECFNSNGIVRTPDKQALLIVQTNTGKIFRVEPSTGEASEVDLGGERVLWGDGMVLEGTVLHVVQNLENTVSVIELDATGSTGKVIERWTDPRFDTPTCMARFGDRFYLSNARFTTPSPETAEFRLIAVKR
ncbi:SMP-30/gluconolactonase/LRE family protein [Kribbella sp. NPDC050470]|uniref:SMP-30/gluconolactonase/LRE family protein n=1 Tax=unclassified Kribbella TaxID=2644121 RepID=UPI0037B81BA9